jgi:hypothetical protein
MTLPALLGRGRVKLRDGVRLLAAATAWLASRTSGS